MQLFLTLLSWILATLGVVLFFSLTILVHEGGHFLVAKKLGLRADVFSLGFGPALWKRTFGGTEYRVCCIPFGGYVSLPQLDPEGMEKLQGAGGAEGALPPAAWWKRLLVAVAGPVGNLLFAALLALVVWALPPVVPDALRFDGAVIGYIEAGSAAEEAGLRIGDRILRVADKPTASWNDVRLEAYLCAENGRVPLSVSNVFDHVVGVRTAALSENRVGFLCVSGMVEAATCSVVEVMPGLPAGRAGFLPGDVLLSVDGARLVSVPMFLRLVEASAGKPLTVRILRDGEERILVAVPERTDPGDGAGERALLGIRIEPVGAAVPQWAQFRKPWPQLRSDIGSIARLLRPIVSGRDRHRGEAGRVGKALGGPLMILSNLWLIMLGSFAGTLSFVRFLNINLAIVNLLPIPVLDGGHVLFALWRGLTGRELPKRVMTLLVNLFAYLVLALFVFLSFRDVLHLSKVFGR